MTKSSINHLSWENFRTSVFLHGQQRVHRVANGPPIEIFGDGVSNRIGIWIEIPGQPVVPDELNRLALITTRIFEREHRNLLEVATVFEAFHRQFYHFATAVAERILVQNASAMDAVSLELQCFSELLEQKSLLGIERQLGVLGELIFLERLMVIHGAKAWESWIGPQGEPHDFRLETAEFEVKTTTSACRVHTISSAEQLIPSAGHSLFLVSVQLAPAGTGEGFSLAQKIESIERSLSSKFEGAHQFASALERYGLFKGELAHYTRRFTLRHPLAIVPVDANFPAITRLLIQKSLGPLATRIESLIYDINVDGLECEDGSEAFAKILRI